MNVETTSLKDRVALVTAAGIGMGSATAKVFAAKGAKVIVADINAATAEATPADAYFGRAPAIIQQRERIKRQTIEYRRLQHRKLAA
jgi:NAD(P)-dependent dehydrogenase (short-subunit alcohol dehydrogenase family)